MFFILALSRLFADSNSLRTLSNLSFGILLQPLMGLVFVIFFNLFNDKFSILVPCETSFFLFLIFFKNLFLNRCFLDGCSFKWVYCQLRTQFFFANFEQVKIDGYFTSFEQVRSGYFVQVKIDGQFANFKQARAVMLTLNKLRLMVISLTLNKSGQLFLLTLNKLGLMVILLVDRRSVTTIMAIMMIINIIIIVMITIIITINNYCNYNKKI